MAAGSNLSALREVAEAYVASNPVGILAPFILALVFDCIFLGIFVNQFIFWFSWSSPRDRLKIKIVVYGLAALVTGMTIYLIFIIINLSVLSFTSELVIFKTIDYVTWIPLWDTATVSVAQIFYTERAYRLNGKKIIIPIVVCFIGLLSWTGCIGVRVISLQILDFRGVFTAKPFFFLWLTSGLVVDIILMSLISRGLWKSRTGWSHTDNLVKRLILLSVETQLPGTIVALAYIIQFGIKPDSTMDAFFAVVQPKVYAVSLMAVLNARLSLSGANFTLPEVYQSNKHTGGQRNLLKLDPRVIVKPSSDGIVGAQDTYLYGSETDPRPLTLSLPMTLPLISTSDSAVGYTTMHQATDMGTNADEEKHGSVTIVGKDRERRLSHRHPLEVEVEMEVHTCIGDEDIPPRLPGQRRPQARADYRGVNRRPEIPDFLPRGTPRRMST